jgi:HNH endonuclease
VGPLAPEACRRLACDGAVTRVLVTRHPSDHHPGGDDRLAGRLRAAARLLPPALGGAPTQPLEVGRTSRVVSAAQRAALVVRDGGCAFPGCDRPLAWCEAHHLRHWLHGGPTDLANLALVCRAHHRAVHEGGWRLVRDPDGRLTASPPYRRPQRAPAA